MQPAMISDSTHTHCRPLLLMMLTVLVITPVTRADDGLLQVRPAEVTLDDMRSDCETPEHEEGQAREVSG